MLKSPHGPDSLRPLRHATLQVLPGWALRHNARETKIPPLWLSLPLCRTLDAEGCVLVWYDVVFVLWIWWLVLRWDDDLLWHELGACEVFEEICVVGLV